MERPSIGLAMILKDEAHNLERLLGSVKGCVDQICVTDTGSTDSTKELAQSLGAEVYDFKWCDDFSKARQASFEPMKTDYVLWLDGDDILEGAEEFKTWRNEIMHLADFWLANYVYSSKPDGSPGCVFVRERVVKRSKNLKWKYFVHEGLLPEACKTQFIPSWKVRHMRTDSDLQKDRSRNLNLFEKNTGKLDQRMLFYWGKELFEANKHLDAIRRLEDVLASPEPMEIHDRILAMQYLAMSYMQLNQFEKAIGLALTGLQVAPQRAEFYTIIGDSYLKLNQMPNALPFFQAASQCHLPQTNQTILPIFFHEDAYTFYPKNQLARIYANLGDMDKAKKIALECFTQYHHPETGQILDELNRITNIIQGIKSALPCQDIVFSCPQSPTAWDGEEYRKVGTGGSETACIEMAESLAKITGRPVKVFNPRADQKTVNGVQYLPFGQINHYMASQQPWVHIAWRHSIKLTDAPTFVWCHDLITPGIDQVGNYHQAIALTPFHSHFMHNMQLVPYDKIWVSRNGIDPTRFKKDRVKNPNKIVFPSSPDRGLDRAILVVEEARKHIPDLELHVFYGIEHLPQWGHQALHDKLKLLMSSRPWVKYHGKTEQRVLSEHLAESVVWLHPCDFIETSCITAMEMIASGVYPVTRKLGGLKDTLKEAEEKGMATLLPHDCVTEWEFEEYKVALLDALLSKKWEHEGFKTFDPSTLSWEKVAEEWVEKLSHEISVLGSQSVSGLVHSPTTVETTVMEAQST